ncbi:MAG: hypothetical protein MJ239_00390 [Bacilli bacterium]|nr:hypothetical protein [Bacilli bacterium]
MHWTEIFTIAFIVLFLAFMIWRIIYRKKKGITDCNCGSGKGKALVDAYHKQKEHQCCCNQNKTQD